MPIHAPLPPFAATSGPRRASIALVGEAWGQQEALLRAPFQGQSGQELDRMLREAGIRRADCFATNVFALRPQENKLETLMAPRAAVLEMDPSYSAPAISQGRYLLPQYLCEVERLLAELAEVQPCVTVALGATACWALLRSTGIGAIRGTVVGAHLATGLNGPAGPFKVLPTYHPAGVLRNWAWRPIVVADLMKARRESQFPEIRRPHRRVLVSPTLDDLFPLLPELLNARVLGCDIETGWGQIRCIGFAPSRSLAVVVPFVDLRRTGGSYWPDTACECRAWDFVRAALEGPAPKVFQNGLYDLQYISRMGIRPRNCTEDTMLLHHSHYPELQKGLGFLGSIYSSEAAWKLMNRPDSTKRDE